MDAIRFIWAKLCELDHKLVQSFNSGDKLHSTRMSSISTVSTTQGETDHLLKPQTAPKKVITTLTGSARGKEISKKIEGFEYYTLEKFRIDVTSLFDPPHITRFTYISADSAAGAKLIIARLILRAERDCALETERYMPEFRVLLPDHAAATTVIAAAITAAAAKATVQIRPAGRTTTSKGAHNCAL